MGSVTEQSGQGAVSSVSQSTVTLPFSGLRGRLLVARLDEALALEDGSDFRGAVKVAIVDLYQFCQDTNPPCPLPCVCDFL
jgi:hypothetical protein